MRMRSNAGFLCCMAVFTAVPLSSQTIRETHGDWVSRLIIDAMTDSITNRAAYTLSYATTDVNPSPITVALWVLCYPGVQFSFKDDDVIPTDAEFLMVRYRFDQDAASNWERWWFLYGNSGVMPWAQRAEPGQLPKIDHSTTVKFVDRAKRGRDLRLRAKVPGPFPEWDWTMRFSLTGFTRAYSAACGAPDVP